MSGKEEFDAAVGEEEAARGLDAAETSSLGEDVVEARGDGLAGHVDDGEVLDQVEIDCPQPGELLLLPMVWCVLARTSQSLGTPLLHSCPMWRRLPLVLCHTCVSCSMTKKFCR